MLATEEARIVTEALEYRLTLTALRLHSPPEVGAERLGVCSSCTFLTSTLGVDSCGRCKRFITLQTHLIDSTCPLDKWER